MVYRKYILSLLSLVSLHSYAQVYMCETNGTVEYTNTKKKGCKEMNLPKLTTIPAPMPAVPPAFGNKNMPNSPFSFGANQPPPLPSNNLSIPPILQNKREDERKNILKQELQAEQRKLDQLKKEYNAGNPERRGDERNYQKYIDRVEQLKKDIERAQGNTQSIMKELGI